MNIEKIIGYNNNRRNKKNLRLIIGNRFGISVINLNYMKYIFIKLYTLIQNIFIESPAMRVYLHSPNYNLQKYVDISMQKTIFSIINEWQPNQLKLKQKSIFNWYEYETLSLMYIPDIYNNLRVVKETQELCIPIIGLLSVEYPMNIDYPIYCNLYSKGLTLWVTKLIIRLVQQNSNFSITASKYIQPKVLRNSLKLKNIYAICKKILKLNNKQKKRKFKKFLFRISVRKNNIAYRNHVTKPLKRILKQKRIKFVFNRINWYTRRMYFYFKKHFLFKKKKIVKKNMHYLKKIKSKLFNLENRQQKWNDFVKSREPIAFMYGLMWDIMSRKYLRYFYKYEKSRKSFFLHGKLQFRWYYYQHINLSRNKRRLRANFWRKIKCKKRNIIRKYNKFITLYKYNKQLQFNIINTTEKFYRFGYIKRRLKRKKYRFKNFLNFMNLNKPHISYNKYTIIKSRGYQYINSSKYRNYCNWLDYIIRRKKNINQFLIKDKEEHNFWQNTVFSKPINNLWHSFNKSANKLYWINKGTSFMQAKGLNISIENISINSINYIWLHNIADYKKNISLFIDAFLPKNYLNMFNSSRRSHFFEKKLWIHKKKIVNFFTDLNNLKRLSIIKINSSIDYPENKTYYSVAKFFFNEIVKSCNKYKLCITIIKRFIKKKFFKNSKSYKSNKLKVNNRPFLKYERKKN